ncbi:MAG: hypothetical protein U1F77_19980 [Kiritimatiellia bacterium]
MAMFISKFHKLIESKVFWYGIIGVMIVTMTLSLVPNVHDYGSFIQGFMVHNAETQRTGNLRQGIHAGHPARPPLRPV